ncbi:MAG: NERD domain-containing protein [Chloroflexi bacterium]|nr:NERD domain-containing protein [Nitrososphaera sp.]MCI0727636.1 NERD domain-containing protein [Chloroflexota bacterium]
MATMFPPRITPGTKSLGEGEAFLRLRDDPATASWYILHSLDIAEHQSQIFGEIDFVIIVPHLGVLCLEVKGCRTLRRENGLWYYGRDSHPDARGPFKQAASAMHSIRRHLASRDVGLNEIVFWSAVLFPFVEFSTISNEWHPWQVIDSQQFRNTSLSDLILGVLDKARAFLQQQPHARWFQAKDNRPSRAESEYIAKLLRPHFEFFEPPEVRAMRRAAEVKHYTEEQFAALDAMEINDRVIFSGPAGTGKTLLALETVRRSASSGKPILFVCFNRLLGSWLRNQTESFSSVTTSTLHSHMLAVANVQLPENASGEFWSEHLPQLAIDELLQREGENPFIYDMLIIDEAQDILSKLYLDFLDLSLRGGLASGRWRLFGDFEKQTIFGPRASEIQEILARRFSSVPRYSLRVNCRNTPRIAEAVRLFGSMSPGYTRVLRPDNNVEPSVHTYTTDSQQGKILLKSIQELHHEGFAPNDIVILSPRTGAATIPSLLGGQWNSRLISFKELGAPDLHSSSLIRYGTVHYFKGMEAPAVIITGIEEVSSERGAALLYIAMSRALHRLTILVSERARQELLEVLAQ